MQTGEVATARALVAAGLGVAVVPHPLSSTTPGTVHLPLTDPEAERQIGVARPVHGQRSPAVDRFLTFLLRTSE